MNKFVKFHLLLSLVAFMGCSILSFGKTTVSVSPIPFVDDGYIVNRKLLQKETNIAIIPFKASVKVEANEALDKVALRIVGGIFNAFKESDGKQGHFHVLTADDNKDPDLIIQGHITGMDGPSKVGRWALLKKKKMLSVEGKVVDAQTGERVVVFSDSQETRDKQIDYKQLGYRIGENIGRFILSGVEGTE